MFNFVSKAETAISQWVATFAYEQPFLIA